jgi:CXXC-20-CXXC protein
MENFDNNQCPNCGHRFNSLEMLLWGFSKTNNCPDCEIELSVNKDRVLILWVIGIIAIFVIRLNVDLGSLLGWTILTIFIVIFCMISIRIQKLEIKNKP